jgi:hypothetical protein
MADRVHQHRRAQHLVVGHRAGQGRVGAQRGQHIGEICQRLSGVAGDAPVQPFRAGIRPRGRCPAFDRRRDLMRRCPLLEIAPARTREGAAVAHGVLQR